MSETIEVSGVIPAAAERIFNAWLSGDEHGRMIGSSASYSEDGSFTAWDGYITGRTLEQTPHSRIVQAWRTNEFPEGAPDSRLEVLFTPEAGATLVTLRHSEIPDGQGQSYKDGWIEHYLQPMTKYFDTASSKLRGAGEAMTDAAEKVGEAGEAVSEVVNEAVAEVRKTAKKAATAMRKLVKKAQTTLRSAPKKAAKAAKKVRASARKAARRVKPKARPKKVAKKVAKKAKRVVRKASKKVGRKKR